MNNYFLHSGLLRDGDLSQKHEQVQFIISQLLPAEFLVLSFQLILAEKESELIEICRLSDVWNRALVSLNIKQDKLQIDIFGQLIEFEIQKIQLYRPFPIFLVIGRELTVIMQHQKATHKINQLGHIQYNRFTVTLGSSQRSFTGIVRNFNLRFHNEKDLQIQMDTELRQQKSIFNELNIMGHIRYRIPYTLPLDSLEALGAWKPLEDLYVLPIQQLRNINKKSKINPVIVCHDMNNGYKEDIWSFGNTKRKNSYRFNYLMYCDIFIYFSHHFITIPTVPYINVCHQFGTRILGTIILEGEEKHTIGTQLFDHAYADKLVQICAYYKFDGYLLNLEIKILDIPKLLDFMQYLREKLQPLGAILIYYDSHNNQGHLQWQSCLNEQNYQYFESSGYFFGDYHYDEHKVQVTANHAINHKDRVFMGLDVWGRGQFGGGQMNSHRAVDLISSNSLGIAFFAPAWTYETAGESQTQFLQKDNAFWQGNTNINLFDKHKNNWVITANGGQGWKVVSEDGEDVAIASFDWCVRVYTVQLNLVTQQAGGTVQFSVKVKGTGPKFDDFYLLGVELLNSNMKCIASIDSFTNKVQQRQIQVGNFNIAEERWKEHNLSIKTTEDTCYLKVIEIGKDAEFWAGNYGAQFKGESIVYVVYNPERDLTKKLKSKCFQEFPVQSYFNISVGEHYFIDGEKCQHYKKGFYDNLNDYDFLFCYPTKKVETQDLQSNWECQYCFEDAWNGSNCLRLKGELLSGKSFELKLFKLDLDIQDAIHGSLDLKGFDKKQFQFSIVLKYSDKSEQVFKPTKQLLNKGWNYLIYKIANNVHQVKSVKLRVTNISNQVLQCDGLIGGLNLYDDRYAEAVKQIDLKDPTKYIKNIQLKESLNNLYDLYIQLDFTTEQEKLIKTIRIFNDKTWVGNFRSNYIFISDLPFDGKEMFIKLQLMLQNGNHLKSDSILPVIIYSDQIVRLI